MTGKVDENMGNDITYDPSLNAAESTELSLPPPPSNFIPMQGGLVFLHLSRIHQCMHCVSKLRLRTPRTCAADMEPARAALEAVEAILFNVCDDLNGMIKPGKTVVRETIRCALPQRHVHASVLCQYGLAIPRYLPVFLLNVTRPQLTRYRD